MPKSYTLEQIKKFTLPGNMLTVVDFDKPTLLPSGTNAKRLKCVCICGKAVSVLLCHYTHNKTKSCGCYRDKVTGNNFRKYSGNILSINNVYGGMRRRCYDEKHKAYKYYGGRGVIVCEEWLNDYQSFLDWSKANGWQKGLKLDKDIKGNGLLYSPDTCCWVTHKENMNHTSRCRKYMYNGELLTLSVICQMNNVHYDTIANRMKRGKTFELAISLPINNKNNGKIDKTKRSRRSGNRG